jgi:hypothetical protein
MNSRYLVSTLLFLVTGAGSACAQAQDNGELQPLSEDAIIAAASIEAGEYLRKLGVMAHDSMGGRDTPSRGLEMTAAWIASEFERVGLVPGGDDGSFLQRYPIETVRPDLVASSARVNGGGDLRFGRDLLIAGTSEGDLEGEVVMLSGMGEMAPEVVSEIVGKHVVVASMLAGLDRAGQRFVSDLLRDGALSALVVVDVPDNAWDRYAERLSGRSALRVGGNGKPTGFSVEVRASSIRLILSAHGVDLDKGRGSGVVSVIHVPGLVLTLSPRVQVLDGQSAPNVVGILEGSDPVLREEYVVFSAHMDHIGIGTPDLDGDSINNGADDDASGTTAILEIAEAFASLPTKPKRSMIFLTVSGEEKGLWGSAYFADNPPVPIESMVADLNADMVGRNWPDTIVAIGMEHSDLGETLMQVNEAHPDLGMTAIDDIWPGERFYFRSDHYNFARKGVPVLFFFNGTHEDYHGLNDEVDRINAEKAVRISRLIFYLGYEIANRTARPRWNPESRREIVTDR